MKKIVSATMLLFTFSSAALFAFGGNFNDVNPRNQNVHLNYGIREEILQQNVWNNTIYYNGQKLNPYNMQPREYRPNPLIHYDGWGYF